MIPPSLRASVIFRSESKILATIRSLEKSLGSNQKRQLSSMGIVPERGEDHHVVKWSGG